MPYRIRPLVLAFVVTAASSFSAASQDIPNLVGTWRGFGHAVHVGPNPYRSAEGSRVNFPANAIEFTYVIKEQHGNSSSLVGLAMNLLILRTHFPTA